MSRAPKEPQDQFITMDLDQLQEFLISTSEQLKEAKMKRNFVQQEREMINSYYEISRDEEKQTKMEIEKVEFLIQTSENKHKEDINGFVNKFRHLEYDHDLFITDTLEKNSQNSIKKEEEIRGDREKHYLDRKADLKKEIKDETELNRKEIEEQKNKLDKRYLQQRDLLENRLNFIVNRYKNDMKQLEDDLELRLKVEIHELEERKNLHINNLIRAFEDRMDAWKKENIEQIKENINLIKTNNENLKALKTDNEALEKEVEELKKDIGELEKLLESAQQEHSEITNRLAKYYNQQINITNMNAKVNSLHKKCDEVVRKTEEIEGKKRTLMDEIKELKERFVDAVLIFKEKSEKSNDELDKKINQLNDNYTKREIQIEEYMKNVDYVLDMDNQEENKEGFGREMFDEMLESIRSVLTTKTQIIKNLKYSLALATKVKLL
jgi:growth arrest-specific protein 8